MTTIKELCDNATITIHYYIGGDLCTGNVNDDYINESEKRGICNIFGYSKSYKAQVYIHPVDGRFFIPV